MNASSALDDDSDGDDDLLHLAAANPQTRKVRTPRNPPCTAEHTHHPVQIAEEKLQAKAELAADQKKRETSKGKGAGKGKGKKGGRR